MNKTQNPLPSLKEAKEYASFIKEPKNGQIVLLNSVAPMQNEAGVFIDKQTQANLQKIINRQGMLIVMSNYDEYKEGEKILLNEHPQFNLTRIINTKLLLEGLQPDVIRQLENKEGKFKTMQEDFISSYYKKYVIIILHPTNIACTVN